MALSQSPTAGQVHTDLPVVIKYLLRDSYTRPTISLTSPITKVDLIEQIIEYVQDQDSFNLGLYQILCDSARNPFFRTHSGRGGWVLQTTTAVAADQRSRKRAVWYFRLLPKLLHTFFSLWFEIFFFGEHMCLSLQLSDLEYSLRVLLSSSADMIVLSDDFNSENAVCFILIWGGSVYTIRAGSRPLW